MQLAGTLFFNLSTVRALRIGIEASEYDRVVWSPTLLGSICFLVSGLIALAAVRDAPRRSISRRLAVVNLGGCVAFALSAAAAYVVPSRGSALDPTAARAWTAIGALCFLVAALPLARGATAEAPA